MYLFAHPTRCAQALLSHHLARCGEQFLDPGQQFACQESRSESVVDAAKSDDDPSSYQPWPGLVGFACRANSLAQGWPAPKDQSAHLKRHAKWHEPSLLSHQ